VNQNLISGAIKETQSSRSANHPALPPLNLNISLNPSAF